MEYNVFNINSNYHFMIHGASYAGKPISGTAMYITKKVEALLENLQGVENCLVFIENGMNPSAELKNKNCFVESDNPQLEYARFMMEFAEEKFKQEKKFKYKLTDEGYYIGENVTIGEDSYIEPGCLIGHGVVIGQHCRIYAGAVIKNAIIGDNFLCNEKAVVGANGFTMAEDEDGNKFRIPTLGKVVIGNNVEVGALDNISCGSAGYTEIEDYVKIDAHVHIGHDVLLHKNTEITAASVLGGFDRLEEKVFVGLNSCLKNRIVVGAKSAIGMGSVVTQNVKENSTVFGNPARQLLSPKASK